MKTVSLSGALRAHVGKKDAKKLRREEKVPCVIYGGKEQIHFVLEEKDFKKLLFTPETFHILINIDGKEYSTVLQDIQYHPVSDKVLHADFLEVLPGKPVAVPIPVKYEGTAPGIIKGGKLITKMRKVKVKGLLENIPEFITLDISKLDIGNSIKIRDIKLDNLQMLDVPSAVVVSVKTARGVKVEAGEEGEEGEETGETTEE
jgi:large subunit ribosomal protein L25